MTTPTMTLPKPIIRFTSGSTQIGTLLRNSGYNHDSYPWAKRFVGKFPLPTWQRELVWSEAQKVSFVKSIYMGYDLGSVMINGYQDNGKGILRPMSDILIDGQQRVSSIVGFASNEFSLNGLYWRDLNRLQQRRLLECPIGKKSVECFDEEKLKTVYNHLNFSGTNHLATQKA